MAAEETDLERLVRLRRKRREEGVGKLNWADNLWLAQVERPLKATGHLLFRRACDEWVL